MIQTQKPIITKDDLGFMLIAEQVSPDENIVKDLKYKEIGKSFFVQFHTILQTFRKKNRNGRKYWGPNVNEMLKAERITTLLSTNAWYGEMDHPYSHIKSQELSPERVQTIEMSRRSHKIMNPVVQGDVLSSEIQTASGTEYGEGFAKEIIQGLIPSFSARAIASIQMINGEPYVVMRKLITYDWVLYPSHHEANMDGKPKFMTATLENADQILSGAHAATMLESQGSMDSELADDIRSQYTQDIMISLKEILEMVGRDSNVNAIMESFELGFDDIISLDSTMDHAIIKDGDNRVYANISRDTKNEVSDYLSSFF